jgi:ATP-binding protein involved in chromosome partitioning
MTQVTKDQVVEALRQVIEPELHKDLITLNMIENIEISDANVKFTVMLTTPACPLKNRIESECVAAVSQIPGVSKVTVNFDARVPGDAHLMGKLDIGVRNAIAVASGKGGVGKSTVATNLALSLALDGAKVGLLDADIYGPNIPLMMGVNDRPRTANNKIIPPVGHGVKLMSIGFLVEDKQPLVWRGPMLHSAIRQFLHDVDWNNLDYLVIDLPPGTGDASLSLTQSLNLTGTIVVTTPQQVATSDVVRSVSMFRQLRVPVLGVVENMSYFVAPDTGHRYDIFGQGGGRKMAEEIGIPFLGEVPLEIIVRESGDGGTPVVVRDPEAAASKAIHEIAQKIAAAISVQNLSQGPDKQFTADPGLRMVQ